MSARIHGWERTATDPVLVRRFVRALFEGDTEGVEALVSDTCEFHGSWVDEGASDRTVCLETAVETVGATGLTLESIETTDSDGLIEAAVTTSGRGGTTEGSVAGAESAVDGEAVGEPDAPPFVTCRVEDDRIVEVWLHLEQLGTWRDDPLGTLLGRVSAWLHAD
jgi:hypothetical protein